jgi:hypothetical protein
MSYVRYQLHSTIDSKMDFGRLYLGKSRTRLPSTSQKVLHLYYYNP